MPPVSPQGSRAGLITALVIFVILFVTTTILFIYQSAETKKAQDQVNAEKAKYTAAVSEAVLAEPGVAELIAAGKETNKSGIEVAIDQRDSVVKAVLGGPGNAQAAIGQAQAAIAKAGRDQKVVAVPQSAGLAAVVGSLVDTVAAQARAKDALTQQLAAAQQAADDTLAGQKDLLAQRDAQIAELSGKYETAMTELTTYRAQLDTNVAGIETSAKGAIGQAQAAQTKLAQQVTQLQTANAEQKKENDNLRRRLGTFRINTKEPIVQVADGRIARLPGNNSAYIDLGAGNQVAAGMTFEVYDKYTGIPALGQDGLRETDMPVGKASIEVMRVSAGSSECRIIRKTPGQEIVEGDFIANLVYDQKTKYNFVVYGEFDLDRNGVAATSDAEVIKQLITRWGGRIQPAINADADFVIMGKEPAVPELSEEERQDPVRQKEYEEAVAALNAYQDVVGKANDYGIPVMNQNRFLYFSGYYSQAPR